MMLCLSEKNCAMSKASILVLISLVHPTRMMCVRNVPVSVVDRTQTRHYSSEYPSTTKIHPELQHTYQTNFQTSTSYYNGIYLTIET